MHTMKTAMGVLLAAALALLSAAQTPGDARRQEDLVAYNALLHKIKQLDQDYARAVKKAMEVARRNGGKADRETLATLLSLRDQRDRVMARATVLGLRYGWELPGSATQEIAEPASVPVQDELFRPAEHIVKSTFADEAARIARSISLPLIEPPQSLSPPSPRADSRSTLAAVVESRGASVVPER